jgi:hypothetical protein
MTRTAIDGERRMRGRARQYLLLVIAVCAMTAGGTVVRGAQAPAGSEADLAEGQRLFEELDYEHAVPLLSRAIIALEPMAPQQPQARTALVSAYGMRARALFGLDDPAKAQDDFRALLAIDPSYALSGQISPRVVALFDKVKVAVVGSLALSVNPPDARLELNGLAASVSSAPVPLTAGEYIVKATRLGYRSAEETVTVVPGETKQFSLTLERTSSVVFVVTWPHGDRAAGAGVRRGAGRARRRSRAGLTAAGAQRSDAGHAHGAVQEELLRH